MPGYNEQNSSLGLVQHVLSKQFHEYSEQLLQLQQTDETILFIKILLWSDPIFSNHIIPPPDNKKTIPICLKLQI